MDYKIFTPDGVVVNTIVAPNSSFVENYCAKYGYTYERIEEPAPTPRIPTELELAQQDITDLQLNDIEQGQQMTDLELTILGGVTNV